MNTVGNGMNGYPTKPLKVCNDDVAHRFTHRLAVMLECALLNPERTWDDAHKLLNEYQQAIRQQADAAGLPYVSPMGKD
jgi:hypothetical protein